MNPSRYGKSVRAIKPRWRRFPPQSHGAYFLHRADVVTKADNGDPTRIEVKINDHVLSDDVVTVGSDGGGGLFCFSHSDGAVYQLEISMIDENNVLSTSAVRSNLSHQISNNICNISWR
jgi:hypothetical protein